MVPEGWASDAVASNLGALNRRLALILLIPLLATAALAAEIPAPDELLTAAISRHDPDGTWESGGYRLVVRGTRPDGTSSDVTISIDNRAGTFQVASFREGTLVAGSLGPDQCEWTVNGTTHFSDETRERLRLTCERLERMRNYYTYLWGLPMKLRDPGTRLGDTVAAKDFEGRPALELRVTYDEEIGSDVWYVYFDPDSHEMIGYRFYHDEAANDGEYITLEGVEEGAGLRLPKTRTWYTHQENKYLATDSLMSIEPLD